MLGYLLDPAIQVQNENGVTIAGARIYVYNSNTSVLAETYKDFNGTRNTNPIITDALGNCTVIAEDSIAYDVVFKDEQDNLLFSKQNITVTHGGSGTHNVQVVAGYGIEVTPSLSAGVQKYEVAIDQAIVETFDSITKYTAGDNIVLTDLPNNEKAINLTDEVIFSENNYQSRLNSRQNTFTNASAHVSSIQNAAGFYVSDDNQTEFTDIAKNYIQIVGPSTASIDKSLVEQNNLLQIDYADNGNSTYKTLSATPDDVTIWRHRGSGPAEYSLTGACTSAQTALAAVLSGDLTPYSAGANINITNHVVSGKDWTSTINAATSGKLNTSTFNTYTAAHTGDDVTLYSGGTGISVYNHQISCTGDITPYSAGNNINITNHVVSGKNWSSDISNAVAPKLDTSAYNAFVSSTDSWDKTPYTGGTGISVSSHQISCTGDITSYSGGTGISVSSHQISCTGDITPYTGGTGISVNSHQIAINAHSNYRVDISKEFTVTSNDQYVNFTLSDEFDPVRTWLNANYRKMTCPLFFTLKVEFDSQVQNPGTVYMNYGYSVYHSGDPIVSIFTPYAYITKFWSGMSDAHIAGTIEAKSMYGYASFFELRNMESTTKWTTGQKLTVTVSFYTQYIN